MENLLLKRGWNEAKIHDECWPIFDGKESPQNFFGIWITVCSFFFKLTYPKSQLNKYSAHTKRVLYWRSFQLKRCRNQQTWLITLDLPNVIWSRWWLIIPVIFMQIEKFFGRFFLEPERSVRKKSSAAVDWIFLNRAHQ